ncbi:hypothetical protein ACSBR2_042205 [Camellia fascicularis]
MIIALKIRAYGVMADYMDEYLRIGESNTMKSLKNYDAIDGSSQEPVSHKNTHELMEFIQNHHRIRDKETHSRLQADLVQNLWQVRGQS